MASNTSFSDNSSEIHRRFFFFNVLKNGQIQLNSPPTQKVPALNDQITGVNINDVTISDEVSARIFLPPSLSATEKLPVLLYFHGGGYCMQSAFSFEYTRLLTRLAGAGKILAVSVEYGLFPDRPIPACYDDSWAALRWVASHDGGSGPEPWLNQHADLRRVFAGGDSAGGNIAHQLAVRAGAEGTPRGLKLKGILMMHPHFLEGDEMWMFMCPTNEGPTDRRLRPTGSDLEQMGCERVLIMVAQWDNLREGGKRYVVDLEKSGWKGKVEFVYNEGKEHCFHVHNPDDEDALANQRRVIEFIHRDD